MTAALALVITAALLAPSFGDPAYFANRKGNELYKEGRYEDALAEYSNAQSADPESKIAEYNLGGALFRLGRYEEAARAYAEAAATEDEEMRADAGFNRGAALYKAGGEALAAARADQAGKLLEESVKQYKSLLRDNPADNGARHNLELALEKLKEIEKQRKEKENEKKEKQEAEGETQKDSGEAGKDERKEQAGKEGQSGGDEDETAEEINKDEDKGRDERGDIRRADGKEAQSGQAEMVFRAVEQDERSLREKLRGKALGDAPKTGKDW